MEKLKQYQNYVQQVIKEYAQIGSKKDEIEQQLIVNCNFRSLTYLRSRGSN